MYFKIFKPISWGKRPAERRRRFIQRFLKFSSGIKQQAGANKSVCSCLFCLRRAWPPNLLARRRFNDPAYCIALFHTIPLRVLPLVYRLGRKNSPDAQRLADASGCQKSLRQNQSTNENRFTESEDCILRSVFSIKPTDSVIARRARAPDAAILNETICHPVTKYGRTERNRTLKERKRKRNEAANPLFCNRDSFLFRTPVLRSGMPYLRLKDCHGRSRPRNDTKLRRFLLATQGF